MASSIPYLLTVRSFLPPWPGTKSHGLAFLSCQGIWFHRRIISLAQYEVMTQAYLIDVLAAPILSRGWLFAVLVTSFLLAANEGFHSPHAGGFPSTCGCSCFSNVLCNAVINPSITFPVLFIYTNIYFGYKF